MTCQMGLSGTPARYLWHCHPLVLLAATRCKPDISRVSVPWRMRLLMREPIPMCIGDIQHPILQCGEADHRELSHNINSRMARAIGQWVRPTRSVGTQFKLISWLFFSPVPCVELFGRSGITAPMVLTYVMARLSRFDEGMTQAFARKSECHSEGYENPRMLSFPDVDASH